MASEGASPEMSREAYERAFEELFGLFVEPEVAARIADGRLAEETPLFAAQVLLLSGRPHIVRLNEEVRAIAQVRAARDIEAGEEVDSGDITELVEVMLLDDDEPDAAHVTFLRLDDGWSMVFDFRYNAARIAEHLRLADQYIDTAADALAGARLNAFVENAYCATELCVRAELISSPDPALMKSKRHSTFAGRYNYHAKLGNTELRFARLLNDLARLRGRARYAEGDLGVEAPQASVMLATLRDLRARGEAIRPRRGPVVDATP